MFSFVTYLVVLAFGCMLGNLYSLRPEGVLRKQFSNLTDTKNERSFNAGESAVFQFSPFLLVLQWCLFFGLILFSYARPDFLQMLLHPTWEVAAQVGICVAVPAVWLVFQGILYHWVAYLFHEEGKAMILTRVYNALHILAAPLTLLVFMAEIAGVISPENSWILLLLIFIIAQIVFILSGIMIFWSGIGTLCFIFLYLCAFKIAPILLFLAKLG